MESINLNILAYQSNIKIKSYLLEKASGSTIRTSCKRQEDEPLTWSGDVNFDFLKSELEVNFKNRISGSDYFI